MNSNIKNILKEKVKREKASKKNILWNVLKSISQNNNIKNNIKIYTNFILDKKKEKSFQISRKHRICLLTGKRSSVLKGFSFSRYTVKKLILSNKLTNFKKNNW
jgi:ribosomal protein S14